MLRKKQLFKNREAKISSLTIVALMVMAVFGSVFLILPNNNTVRGDETDFTSHVLITIDHDLVDSNLNNFPIWVYNVSDDFKDESNGGTIQVDGDDIVFYSYDNNTQYAHEIEVYDGATGTIGIWVNYSDTISSSVDTEFWMYYDDDDGVNLEDVPGVWDSDYLAVWHMDDTTSTTSEDSTWNGFNLTKDDVDDPNEITGKVGYAQQFSGAVNDDEITIAGGSGALSEVMQGATQLTLSSWFTIEDATDTGYIIKIQIRASSTGGLDLRQQSGGFSFGARSDEGDAYQQAVYTVGESTAWHYAWGIADYPNDHMQLYINDSLEVDEGKTFDTGYYDDGNSQEYPDTIGVGSDDDNSWYEGSIDEIRLSKINRSSAWRSACYYTMSTPETFLTFGVGSGAGESSDFTVTGLDGNDRMTFTGDSGETVWSNVTAPGGTMLINYNVAPDGNCSEIRVNLSHISVLEGILNTNISLIFDDDDSSWTGDVVGYTGTNFTINEAQWTSHSWGGSPFPIDGAGWVNGTLYCRMRLSIPASASGGTYTTDDCLVWWKVIT